MQHSASRIIGIVIGLLTLFTSAQTAAQAGDVEHSILWIVDGLSVKALEEIDLPNIRGLVREGAYYRRVVGVAPYHANQGRWLAYHRNVSLPNPVMLAGSLFINGQTEYVHQVFQKLKRPTAHSTNSNYHSINDGFTYSYCDDTMNCTDADALYWAREFFKRGKPAYMRIHMQDLGRSARASYQWDGDSPPWADDIWVQGSPYRRTAARVDRQVADFVDFLKNLRFFDWNS